MLAVEERPCVSRLSQRQWDETLEHARELLKRGAEERWTSARARAEVTALLVGNGKELREEMWFAASDVARFATVEGAQVLVSYGKSREDLALAILEESDRPLHYSDVVARIGERFGVRISERNAHAACGMVGLLYGRGTFGLSRHFPFSPEEAGTIVLATEDIIARGPVGKQWHCSELCDELEVADPDLDEELDVYTLCIALRSSHALTYLGRFVWASRSDDDLGTARRLDVTQAAISLLREAGQPLHFKEIASRLASDRGTNCTFQLHPTPALVPLGNGVWGLADRDIGLSREDQLIAIGNLEATLEQRGAGLQVSEIIDSLGLIPNSDHCANPRALMALAQLSGRMKVSRGQYLYLSKWGEPRRLQIADAAREALEQTESGLPIQALVESVSMRLGRTVTREAVYATLRGLGARWNEVTGAWQFDSASDDDVEDGDDLASGVA